MIGPVKNGLDKGDIWAGSYNGLDRGPVFISSIMTKSLNERVLLGLSNYSFGGA